MSKRTGVVAAVSAVLLVGLTVVPAAHAQMAVIDVAAIKQLVAQVNYWKQQIGAMQKELNQLQQTHAALTGPRGMQALLPLNEAQRSYLPRDWAEVARVLDGTSAQYAALAAAVDADVQGWAVLTPERLALMSEAEREQVLAKRRSTAGHAVLTREAYAQAGARFAALAQLVQAIGAAGDAKAIADLQGRIAAEQTMLGNEQAKLALLAQLMEAERVVQGQQLREMAIEGHGTFKTRLRPALP